MAKIAIAVLVKVDMLVTGDGGVGVAVVLPARHEGRKGKSKDEKENKELCLFHCVPLLKYLIDGFILQLLPV